MSTPCTRIPALVLPAVLALLLGACDRPAPAIQQPLAFNHKVHMDADMDCTACHEGAEAAPYATLPTLASCMGCHKEPQGKSAVEEEVRKYAAKGVEIPWVQVNTLVGHVYFSHAAHVTLGKMACKDCHGDMRNAVEPVTRPQFHYAMKDCVECHQQRNATIECLACHK